MPVVITGAATNTNKACVTWQAIEPTITSSGDADGYPAINLIDPATWSSWLASGANGWVRYDFGSAVSIDSVAVVAHELATSAATVSIQSSHDGVTWTTQSTSSPLTDEDILFLFPSVSARYWRILLGANPANISVLIISAKLSFPHTPIDSYTPLHHARTYDKMFNDSINGVMLGNRVMATGAETSVDFGFVQRSFVDNDLRTFEDWYNQGGTFVYSGWPFGQPLDMGYCRAISEADIIAVEYIEGENLANLSFGIHSYVG